ncbi:gamma-glutamylaminecyclotransferase [Acidovorax soli]|uniref:Gamma-glutamylcyclotransferase family protein n=1 Tax=Acidovorax soli TaxID=592050 RepID=A0A7X0PJP2_9BURK|nr:gamma-glutamylcyclotransferase family protein [Acidovorax soli]MBB6563210.1 gamma-glutamylaminecyclotransferase [Acidovorax soli]
MLVFVFGTLKQGFPNFHENLGTRVPGDFATCERYPLYLVGDRHSPWMIDAPGTGHPVKGQVFEVDAPALQRMDLLERVHAPDGYRRSTIEVIPAATTATTPLQVFAYLKSADQVQPGQVRQGPLPEYGLAHAALYRRRHP